MIAFKIQPNKISMNHFVIFLINIKILLCKQCNLNNFTIQHIYKY